MAFRMEPMAIAAVVALSGSPASAQRADGDWQGALHISEQAQLRIIVHIAHADDGNLSGTLDSPDQNAFAIPLANVRLDGAELNFEVPIVAGRFAGMWQDAANIWAGRWRQGGQEWPLVLAPGAPPPAPGANSSPLPDGWTVPPDAEIANVLDARIAGRAGAGIIAGVVQAGRADNGVRVVASGAVGGPAFGADTLFEIGSLTKLFTGLLLADMALKGEVSLDDPVAKYLPPGARMPQGSGRPITLADLSMHISGLPRLPDNMPMAEPGDPYADYTEAHLLEFLGHHSMARDAGEGFEYSNLGVGLLGYALDRAGGGDYASLLRERITAPLGMEDTAIALSADQQARFAQGYDAYMLPARPWHLPVLAGAGALRSTMADMLTFAAAALDPASPIGAAMAMALDRRAPVGPGVEMALGWMVVRMGETDVLLHSGGTGGYRSTIALDPSGGQGVIVLTNAAAEPSTEDVALHLLIGASLAASAPPPAR